MEACVGVSCKYMLVFFLITAVLQSKPMSHSFQEHSLLFSGPIAGFSCFPSLHSMIKRGDADISVPSKSVYEMEHMNLGAHNSTSLQLVNYFCTCSIYYLNGMLKSYGLVLQLITCVMYDN